MIKCYLKAFVEFIKHGSFIPHMYKTVAIKRPVIVISTEDSFRVSTSYEHEENEQVHPNATLIIDKCIYCDRVHLSWIRNKELSDKYIKECDADVQVITKVH